ncbi:hypothetical protein T265_02745 [Opisthorchis viverrini]|uniref:Uncharacterized protein n=1 Tax=Opisthorchis viverrini TaxID=6198 RepID=A0A074ZTX5_OPIVI|nr:hypothetical protein T265_02745 [Opisthorchis viverrini]KER30933.1 hypothetical protein T265_02745 [Opisthorchis viverrini]
MMVAAVLAEGSTRAGILPGYPSLGRIMHYQPSGIFSWQNEKGDMLAAFSAACSTSPIRPQDHWMSSRSLPMIDAGESIPAGYKYDGAFKPPRRQIGKSLWKDLGKQRSAKRKVKKMAHQFTRKNADWKYGRNTLKNSSAGLLQHSL